MSSESFADLGVSRPVVDALAKRGFTEPFAVQRLAIADVLDGHDVLVQSPTGSGKTLAFGVPIVDRLESEARRPSALILAPTRELAEQIVEEMRTIAQARALKVAPVYGGVGLVAQAKRAKNAHIVVATPGRLEDLLERGDITLKHVRILVLDEADRMLDMGFKPPVDRIVKQIPGKRQTLFFSATLEGAAGKLASAYTRDARRHVHKPKVEKGPEIEHRFVHLVHEDKVGALVGELRADGGGRTLVFVRTKRGADRLVKKLDRQKVRAVAMHGNKSQGQRRRALAELRGRRHRHPRRHRRRLARHRRRRHHPGDQLRRPRGPRDLRAPDRAHRPGRREGDRGQLRAPRPGARDGQDREGARARERVQSRPRKSLERREPIEREEAL